MEFRIRRSPINSVIRKSFKKFLDLRKRSSWRLLLETVLDRVFKYSFPEVLLMTTFPSYRYVISFVTDCSSQEFFEFRRLPFGLHNAPPTPFGTLYLFSLSGSHPHRHTFDDHLLMQPIYLVHLKNADKQNFCGTHTQTCHLVYTYPYGSLDKICETTAAESSPGDDATSPCGLYIDAVTRLGTNDPLNFLPQIFSPLIGEGVI